MSVSVDCGTYNLVSCIRDNKNEFQYTREVNAFVEIKLDNRFLFNMMKTANPPIPVIERGQVGYVLGEAAINMAYTMTDLELKRPMYNGCINPKEKDAHEILNIMLHSLIGDVKNDNETLYYSVPANAVNEETDANFHSKTIKNIFDAYESNERHKVKAYPINEGLAVVYAELANKGYTGIGCSLGAGCVNVCFAIYGVPVFQFSIAHSGDWIDRQAAKATHETPTFINQEKTKIDLSVKPETLIERAIQTQYRIMIENTVQDIKKGIVESGKKARLGHGIDIVLAGGTSLPKGFDTLFGDILKQADVPIKIGEIIRPADPLYSVARGALIAAENAT